MLLLILINLALQYCDQHLLKGNSSIRKKHQTKVGNFKNPTLVGKEKA
jgi:hypothetical protein